MQKIIQDLQRKLKKELGAARRAHRSYRRAVERVRRKFGNMAFDHGFLLLEIAVAKGIRGAKAVVAVYDDHSEKTITVEL